MKYRNIGLRIVAGAMVVLMAGVSLTSCNIGGGETLFEKLFEGGSTELPPDTEPWYPDFSTEECQHDWVKRFVVQEATSTSEGLINYYCNNCYIEKTESYELEALEGSEIYELAVQSYCEITTQDKYGSALSLGSGIVFSENGEILTNYHVIENAYRINVVVDGTKYSVKEILYVDSSKDIALLTVDAWGLTPARVQTDTQRTGSAVYAVGNPLGYGVSITKGIISQASRYINGVNYVQHDAAISHGNSGGPLYNEYGEVIGMNTMTNWEGQNINFAISMWDIVSSIDRSNPMSMDEYYNNFCTVAGRMHKYVMDYNNYDYMTGMYTRYIGDGYYGNYYYSRYMRVFESDNSFFEIVCESGGVKFFLTVYEDIDYCSWYLERNDGTFTEGYVYGENFDGTVQALKVTNYSMSDFSTARNTAAEMLDNICSCLGDDLYELGISAYDIGFIYY